MMVTCNIFKKINNKNPYKVIIVHPNINSVRNKFMILALHI